MAEGDITFYNQYKVRLANGEHDWDADTIYVTLHTAYTPNIDTHDDWSDVSATEYGAGSGYTAGGKTLTTTAATEDAANDQADADATNVTWTALGALTPATPSHAIVWSGTHSTSGLICYIELGTTATNGSDYTVAWSSGGVFTLT